MNYQREAFDDDYDRLDTDALQCIVDAEGAEYFDDENDQFDTDDLENVLQGVSEANSGY